MQHKHFFKQTVYIEEAHAPHKQKRKKNKRCQKLFIETVYKSINFDGGFLHSNTYSKYQNRPQMIIGIRLLQIHKYQL